MKRPILFLLLAVLLLYLVACAPIGTKIKMPDRAINNLNFLYDHVDTEFAFCVFGDVRGKTIHVTRIELPYIHSATDFSVHYDPCTGPNLVGIGHSHPPDSACEFSPTDIHSLVTTNAPYGFLVCDQRKLVWYAKKSVIEQLKGVSNGR